nr:phage minor tail protein L [uncultured Mediterranean phage uvMED]|tara:strand:+ start:734 stop:1309 length:576 start_codon:yes stop_codon:yes gene_type:complete
MAVPVSALQSINPGAIIELFTLTLDATLHGSTTVYRFHNGSNMNANGNIVWAGNTYEKFPIQCEGFQFGSTGTLPRPTISVSNIFGTITALLQAANQTTIGNDLNGTKLVRIRTLAKVLDAVNFEGNTNPYGTPDPTAEFPQEIYFLDRKITETRDVVQWEAISALDLVNVKLPKRIATREIFPGIGTFVG